MRRWLRLPWPAVWWLDEQLNHRRGGNGEVFSRRFCDYTDRRAFGK